jgi:hypothetical protein
MPTCGEHQKELWTLSSKCATFSFLTSHFSSPGRSAMQRWVRRGVLLLTGFILCAGSGCTGVNWEHNQQAGLRKAVNNRQRALVEFVSGFDADTNRMHSEVFSDPDVVRLMQRFVAIRLDAGMNKRFAEQLGVSQTPAFFVVRPDMTVSGSYQGTMKADQFRLFLIRNSLN